MKILIENYDSDESTENCLPDYEKNRLQNIKEKEIQIKDVKKVVKETKKQKDWKEKGEKSPIQKMKRNLLNVTYVRKLSAHIKS